MLTKEEEKKVIDGYRKAIGDKRDGLVYKAEIGEVDVQGNKIPLDGAVFTFSKFKFAQYPHIEVKFLSNYQEAISVYFMEADKCGDPVNEYSKEEALSGNAIFDLKDLDTFIKDFKIGDIDIDLYKREKENLDRQVEAFNNFVKETGIKL